MRLPVRSLSVIAALGLASCLPEGDKFTCATDADCVTGYVCFQSFCQKADVVDYCAGITCGDHGSCEVKEGVGACTCAEGYSGDKCDACATGYQDKDGDKLCTKDCTTAALDCGPGSCVDTSGTATCECPVGNEGADCKTCKTGFQDGDGDGTCTGTCATTGLSCGSHGTCSDASGTAKCECEAEYAGNLCDACADTFQDDDHDGTCQPDCANVGLSCGDHGTCSTTSGFAACQCEVLYAGVQCQTCADGTRNDFGVCKGVTKFLNDAQSQEGFGDVILHGDGTSILGIGFSGTINFTSPPTQENGGGWGDAMFVKLDAFGNKVWATRVGGNNREGLIGMDEDASGNVYGAFWNYSSGDFLVGDQTISGVTGGMSLWSLDANGGYRWHKSFNSGELHDVAVHKSSGNIFAVGFTTNTPDLGGGPVQARGTYDGLLYSLTTDGTFRWARTVGSNQSDGAECVAVDSAGNVYVIGGSSGTPDLGQSGGSYPNPLNLQGIWLASYTAAGQHRWSKFFVPTENVNNPTAGPQAIAIAPNDDVYVAWGVRGKFDFGGGLVEYTGTQSSGVWVRYDSSGVWKAQRDVINGQPVSVKNITFDSKGNPVIAGNINNGGADLGNGVLGGGPFWAHFRPDFTPINTQWARSGAYPWVVGAKVRDDGAILLLGATNNVNIDWGSGMAQTPGNGHIWWALLPPVPPPL